MVCQSCVILSHNGHKCITLPQAAGKFRNEMDKLVAEAIMQAREIRDATDQAKLVKEQLDKSFEREQRAIKTTFGKVRFYFFIFECVYVYVFTSMLLVVVSKVRLFFSFFFKLLCFIFLFPGLFLCNEVPRTTQCKRSDNAGRTSYPSQGQEHYSY